MKRYRLGAACDFRIVELESGGDRLCSSTYRLVERILEQRSPFDSLYYYGCDRPIHISYSPQQRRNIWALTDGVVPTRKGIEQWVD